MRAVHIAALVLGCVVLATSVATAETQVVTATHTYIMGDNDSRNDARQLCFMEAKKKVLAQAGALIESRTEVRNFQLTESQIRSYSAAVLSVETINEEYGIANGRTTLSLTVRASVDMEEVRARLRAIAADSTIQKRIEAQQKQIGQLESQVRQLSGQLNTAQTARATELRKERNIIVGEVRELDDKRLAVLKLMQTAEAKSPTGNFLNLGNRM